MPFLRSDPHDPARAGDGPTVRAPRTARTRAELIRKEKQRLVPARKINSIGVKVYQVLRNSRSRWFNGRMVDGDNGGRASNFFGNNRQSMIKGRDEWIIVVGRPDVETNERCEIEGENGNSCVYLGGVLFVVCRCKCLCY